MPHSQAEVRLREIRLVLVFVAWSCVCCSPKVFGTVSASRRDALGWAENGPAAGLLALGSYIGVRRVENAGCKYRGEMLSRAAVCGERISSFAFLRSLA